MINQPPEIITPPYFGRLPHDLDSSSFWRVGAQRSQGCSEGPAQPSTMKRAISTRVSETAPSACEQQDADEQRERRREQRPQKGRRCNDNNERVGSIDDIIIAPDKAISYAIVNAGASLGRQSTMSPFPFLSSNWSTASWAYQALRRRLLKASPEFEYAK